jgi:hypothetical protein
MIKLKNIELKKINKQENKNLLENQLYKPFGLNFLTSFCFLVPIIHSLIREKYQFTIACGTCLISSLFYHSTYNEKLRKFDIISNTGSVIYFTFKCMYYNYYYYLSLIPVFFVGSTYYIFDISNSPKYGIKFHSLIHFVANIGVCLMLETCFTEITCY